MSTAEPPTANDSSIQELVAKARNAQAVYESFKQDQVDAIVRDIGKFVFDNAHAKAKPAGPAPTIVMSNFILKSYFFFIFLAFSINIIGIPSSMGYARPAFLLINS